MQARMTHPVMVLPDAMKALLALSKAAQSGTVPETTHKLIHLRVSQINGCSVCVDMHARELKEAGEKDERIWGVGAWRESPYFSDGERAALLYPRAIVLRTAWVYGAVGQNFVRTMLRLARERPVIGVVADQIGCPTSSRDLAIALVKIACASLDGTLEDQLLHIASPVEATWHELAAAVFGVSAQGFTGELRAITTAEYPTRAKRPVNSRLDSGRLNARLGIRLPDWHDSLVEVVNELEEGLGRTR